MKRTVCVLLAFCLCVCAAACKNKQNIRIGVMADLDSLPIAYAYLNGYLPPEIQLLVFTSAPMRDSALISHNLVGCVSDLLSAIQLAASGANIHVPMATGGSYALVENDSSYDTVAVSSGTIIEYMCDTMHTQYKKTVIASMAERCSMLQKKKIKAAVLPEPFAAYAVQHGCAYVSRNTQTQAGVMVFYSDFTQSKWFRTFCSAYNRAVTEIMQGADLEQSSRFLGYPDVNIKELQPQYTAAAPPDAQSFYAVTDYMRDSLQYDGNVQYADLCR